MAGRAYGVHATVMSQWKKATSEPAGVVIDPTNGGPIDFSDPANCGLIAY